VALFKTPEEKAAARKRKAANKAAVLRYRLAVAEVELASAKWQPGTPEPQERRDAIERRSAAAASPRVPTWRVIVHY
jgi:hypothetical protein